MPFNLFHKKKPEQQAPAEAPQPEEPKEGTPILSIAPEEKPIPAPALEEQTHEPAQESTNPPPEQPREIAPPVEESKETTVEEKKEAPAEPASKTYLKAMPLKELSDLENVKNEVRNGNIIILRITPLAGKSIEDVKTAVNELYQFAESIGGDIARLGEERVVVCPKTIRIWREKTPAPVSSGPLPTAA
jgi:SepF-like predicted cell division protein (DUF552 family)